MMIVCFTWFCVVLLQTLVGLAPELSASWLQILQVGLMCQFPPLIAWVNYADLRHPVGLLRNPAWRASLIGLLIVSEALLGYILLAVYGVLPGVPSFGAFFGVTISALFAAAAIFSALAIQRGRVRRETVRQRSGRRWMLGLYGMMFALVLLIVGAHYANLAFAAVFSFIGSTMPLIFMFTATYHESRFEFFDVFIKRGALGLRHRDAACGAIGAVDLSQDRPVAGAAPDPGRGDQTIRFRSGLCLRPRDGRRQGGGRPGRDLRCAGADQPGSQRGAGPRFRLCVGRAGHGGGAERGRHLDGAPRQPGTVLQSGSGAAGLAGQRLLLRARDGRAVREETRAGAADP